MKISRYIEQLKKYYKEFGDIEIVDKIEGNNKYKYMSAMPFPTLYENNIGEIKNADAQPKEGEAIIVQGFEWDKEISYKIDKSKEPITFVD